MSWLYKLKRMDQDAIDPLAPQHAWFLSATKPSQNIGFALATHQRDITPMN